MMDIFDASKIGEQEKQVILAIDREIPRLNMSMVTLATKNSFNLDLGRSSPFERLPNEIKVMILGLCDAKTVLNVAATGSTLHHFVAVHEVQIARAIVCDTIRPGLRSFAAARHRAVYYDFPVARSDSGENRSAGQKHFGEVFIRNGGLIGDRIFEGRKKDGLYGNFKFSLQVAHQLVSFHETVEFFARTLSNDAVRKGPLLTVELAGLGVEPIAPSWVTQVSPMELQRFEKALYLFEVSSAVLPFVQEFNSDNHEYQMWYDFWICFLPWEHQQVRCVQKMLQDWVNDCVQLQGGFVTDPSNSQIAQFVIQKGLAQLRQLGQSNERDLVQDELTKYLEQVHRSSLPPRTETWLRDMDEVYLPFIAEVNEFRLDARKTLSFREWEDSGPRDAWLHTLLDHRVIDPIFEPGVNLQFSCEECMTKWGVMFWDRSKLLWHSQNTMPTTEDMVKASKDETMSVDDFWETSWGRGT
ncbi:hypothetical protein F4806DRAFT_495633 [Annulohypoxylon nitens]|nr:hypothetical protein F4806DRAFT_495633 [Annulohypoxylon nitens]